MCGVEYENVNVGTVTRSVMSVCYMNHDGDTNEIVDDSSDHMNVSVNVNGSDCDYDWRCDFGCIDVVLVMVYVSVNGNAAKDFAVLME